jgi:hypothetical protein
VAKSRNKTVESIREIVPLRFLYYTSETPGRMSRSFSTSDVMKQRLTFWVAQYVAVY